MTASPDRPAPGQLAPDVSIVVVSYNVRDLLETSLRSLEPEAAALRLEIFVVDNASADGSADMVTRDFPHVILIRNPVNRWLAPANNQALRRCSGRHILFLNPDTELRPGALTELAGYLDVHPDVGIVGAQLRNTDGSLQPSGNALRSGWAFLADALPLERLGVRRSRSFLEPGRDYEEVREVDEVSGACALVRAEVLRQVGLLDERFPYSFEDVDLCIRARRAGWRTVYDPRAKVVHHGGRSRPADAEDLRRRWEQGQLVFVRKHYGWLLHAALRAILSVKDLMRRARRSRHTGATA